MRSDMRDPLSLVPLAIAANGGRIDDMPASQLVAAGLTLLQRSAPLVRALAGRRAAILLPTSPEMIVALAASEGRGAVLVNPLASPMEVAHQLQDADVGAAFTIEALAERLPAGVPRVLLDDVPRSALMVVGDATREIDLGSHVGLDLAGEEGAEGSSEEAAIVYTSAMAGMPLGAVLTHRNLLSNARSTVRVAGMTADDHMLALLPFSHLFGLTVTALAPLIAGGQITTMSRFNPVKALELLRSGTITQVVGVPAIFSALLSTIERNGGSIALPALRLAICGGAPLDRSVQDRWADATGVELRQGYGLTEAGPVSLFNRTDLPNRRGTLGVPLPGVRVSIRDPESGSELPDDVEGELCISGDNVSPGYVSNGESGLGRRDGWLRTGDRGVRHPDGAFSFTGLYKPMFTRNGFNIYPPELERAVKEMPGVREVRVTAVPEASRENDILFEVSGDVTPGAVMEWSEARLGGYKQPSEVRMLPS